MSLAVLLSGQGGQNPAMFDLMADHPAAQDIFAAATPLLGADPRDFARTGGPALHGNRTGQILCCVAGLTAWSVLRERYPGRVVLAGYSIGDLAAWGCAGRFSPASILHLAAARAEAMDEASGPGYGLAGLRGLSRARVTALVEEHGCHLAILNAADSVVAGGAVADLESLCARALASGAARAVLLPVHTPSHTPLLAAASARFHAEVARAEILTPSRLGPSPPPRLLSGLDGAPVFDVAKGLDKLASKRSRGPSTGRPVSTASARPVRGPSSSSAPAMPWRPWRGTPCRTRPSMPSPISAPCPGSRTGSRRMPARADPPGSLLPRCAIIRVNPKPRRCVDGGRGGLTMSRWIYGAGILGAALASSGPCAAQNMALTPPAPPANASSSEPVRHPEPPARPQLHAFSGELPNQRTGPMRSRVVRDICIGCGR